MSRQFTRDWLSDVALGLIAGAVGVNSFGHNDDIDAGVAEDVWQAGGFLTRLTSAETMNIVSTSTDDDGSPVGLGARTVLVAGLDSNFDPVQEVVTMNGTTDVLTSNSYIRVRKLVVLTADATATNTNVGVITATASSAATVQCQIGVTDGISHNIQYTVPNNKSTLLYKVELNVFKNVGGNAALKFDAVITPPSGASFNIVEKAMESDQAELEVFFQPPVKFVEHTDIKMTALSDKADTELYSRFMMIEIDD